MFSRAIEVATASPTPEKPLVFSNRECQKKTLCRGLPKEGEARAALDRSPASFRPSGASDASPASVLAPTRRNSRANSATAHERAAEGAGDAAVEDEGLDPPVRKPEGGIDAQPHAAGDIDARGADQG